MNFFNRLFFGILFSIFLFYGIRGNGQIIAFGPMFRLSLYQPQPKIILGFEVSFYFPLYVHYLPFLPGIDIGIEGDKKIKFIYSDLQIIHLNKYNINEGISFGIFKKKENEKNNFIGFQSTLLGASFVKREKFLIGGDIRIRKGKEYFDMRTGLFGKILFPLNHVIIE